MSERDFVGYGRNPPDPRWPGTARLALNFVINVEEGSERSFPDGHGLTETNLTEVAASPVPPGERDLAAESMFEYGSRVGFWRLHRMFTERRFPVTVFGCALALERNPEIAAAIAEAGWDVCGHGLRWIEHYRLDASEERRQIAEAVQSIESAVGERPRGWYCRYGPSINTRRLLVEDGGFAYDSDAYNDELPYWVQVGERDHLIVPYTLTNNDVKFPRSQVGGGQAFYDLLRDAFEVLHAEGEVSPKMMSVGLHPRVVGHPARSASLGRFLDYVASRDYVWVTRRLDIAEHWRANFAPDEPSARR